MEAQPGVGWYIRLSGALGPHHQGWSVNPLWTYGRGLSINTSVRRPFCPHDQSWASAAQMCLPPSSRPPPPCDYDSHPSSICLEKMTSTPLPRLSGLHVKSGPAFLAAVQSLWNPRRGVFSVILRRGGAEL